jgi:DNA polymerase-3 subunit delta'
MTWQGIHGHDDVVEKFRRALKRGRLASSFLFVGPEGIGKRLFAQKLAQSLLCQASPDELLEPCGSCANCVQALAGTHPDLEMIAKPKDRSFLPLELFIGDKEHRMREGLCHNISLKPFMGGRKIAIVDDADYFNPEGANCLLKTLEEPPPRSVLILIGTSPAKQLPTIRSRCQLIRFQPLSSEAIARLLVSEGLVADASQAELLAPSCGGSLHRAAELVDSKLAAFRSRLYEHLANPVIDSARLAKATWAFVQEAGKDAPARRARLRQVIGLATEFYRQLVYVLSGAVAAADDELNRAVQRLAPVWNGDCGTATECLDRCLLGIEQVDRNANQATLTECWLDDLAKTIEKGFAPGPP